MNKEFLKHHLTTFFQVSLVSGIVAFIGVCLWVFVLTGAFTLPAWVLAIWIIVNILLTIYAIVSTVAHAITLPMDMIGAVATVAGIALIFGGAIAPVAGPGLVSLLDFLAFVVMVVYDLYLLFYAKWDETSEAMKGE